MAYREINIKWKHIFHISYFKHFLLFATSMDPFKPKFINNMAFYIDFRLKWFAPPFIYKCPQCGAYTNLL